MMKPRIGIPSRTATIAPEAWVPRSPNCRRVRRRGSGCAIADEAVEHPGSPKNDKQQGDRDRAPDQPEDQRRMTMRLTRPATEAAKDDADEQESEGDHDQADQGEVEVSLEVTHRSSRVVALAGRLEDAVAVRFGHDPVDGVVAAGGLSDDAHQQKEQQRAGARDRECDLTAAAQ